MAVARDTHTNIVQMAVFTTSNEDPNITVGQVIDWLKMRNVSFCAIGIASFGPIDLNPESVSFGCITTTPKEAWRNYNLLGAFKQAFPSTPLQLETDVNAPALAHYDWLNSTSVQQQQVQSVTYITVGTGIGVGVVAQGKPVHGLLHPEAGHIL